MANNLTVGGNVLVGGTLVVTGTTNLGAAADTVLVTNFNADKIDGADLSVDGTLAANSDVLVPSQKAVKTYADLRALDSAVVKLTGNQTVAGVKTFSSDPVATVPSVRDQGTGAVALKCKIIEIGDWNMDSTDSKTVTHGLDMTKIRMVGAMIRNDDNNIYTGIETPLTDHPQGQILSYPTYVILGRFSGYGFDNSNYDSTSYNRGWLTIWYVA